MECCSSTSVLPVLILVWAYASPIVAAPQTRGRQEGQSGLAQPRALARLTATAALLVAALSVFTGGVAQAHVVYAHGRAYGVMLPSRTATKPLSSLRSRVEPLTVGGQQPAVVYGGGPLMLSSKLYLIFWEQKAGEFTPGYTEPIIHYAEDLQAEDTHTTDEFSVAKQYTDEAKQPITGKVEFGGDAFAIGAYPPLEEAEGCTKAPCVTDKQIRKEIVEQIEANHWPTDPANAPEAQYLIYTPEGVATCEFGECAPEEFCAYHSEITGIGPEHKVAVYSDCPTFPNATPVRRPPGWAATRTRMARSIRRSTRSWSPPPTPNPPPATPTRTAKRSPTSARGRSSKNSPRSTAPRSVAASAKAPPSTS